MSRQLLQRAEALPGGVVWGALALGAVLLVVYAVFIAWLGDPSRIWAESGPPWPDGVNRLNVVVILLMAFLWSVARLQMRRDPDDLRAMQPLTRLSEREFESVIGRLGAFEPGRSAILMGSCALLGLAIVPATQEDPGIFLTSRPWTAQTVWSFGANAVLFSSMGLGIYAASLSRSVIAEVSAAIAHINLLDLSELAPLSRIALRHAVLWAGGSSIASLIFLDVEVLWPVALIIAVTSFLATRAFLEPVRAVHVRIRDAKREELARVRERIVKARSSALEQNQPGAASELPGLLAWEARVSEVPEWPFDTTTLVRFGALLALAIGSWLGGAVVERLLGSVLD